MNVCFSSALQIFFKFSNLAKRNSNFSASFIYTYLIAQWSHSSNAPVFVEIPSIWLLYVMLRLYETISCKARGKAVRLAAAIIHIFLKPEYTEIAFNVLKYILFPL